MKVMQFIPMLGLAGAEIMCENLAYGLKKNNVTVYVVSLYNYQSAITKRISDKKIKIIYLNKKRGFDCSILFKINRLIRQEKPDVIHTHLGCIPYVMPVAIFNNTKCLVHTIHNVAYKENDNFIASNLCRILYQGDFVVPVALSEKIKKSIVDKYCINSDKVPVVFNGEDLLRFKKKESYKIKECVHILHIGRFVEQKNQKEMIIVFAEIIKKGYNCVLHMVGDYHNIYGKECCELVNNLGLSDKIIFEGVHNDIDKFFKISDIFILPSKYEGVPMSIIEAMASAMPIVATKVGGIMDMLDNGKSAILINNDEKELMDAITTLIENEELRRSLALKAYKRSSLFNLEFMTDKYLTIYRRYL